MGKLGRDREAFFCLRGSWVELWGPGFFLFSFICTYTVFACTYTQEAWWFWIRRARDQLTPQEGTCCNSTSQCLNRSEMRRCELARLRMWSSLTPSHDQRATPPDPTLCCWTLTHRVPVPCHWDPLSPQHASFVPRFRDVGHLGSFWVREVCCLIPLPRNSRYKWTLHDTEVLIVATYVPNIILVRLKQPSQAHFSLKRVASPGS